MPHRGRVAASPSSMWGDASAAHAPEVCPNDETRRRRVHHACPPVRHQVVRSAGQKKGYDHTHAPLPAPAWRRVPRVRCHRSHRARPRPPGGGRAFALFGEEAAAHTSLARDAESEARTPSCAACQLAMAMLDIPRRMCLGPTWLKAGTFSHTARALLVSGTGGRCARVSAHPPFLAPSSATGARATSPERQTRAMG